MSIYEGNNYRLRAGSPMPVSTDGDFVVHSFMGEEQINTINTCTDTLVRSSAFRGQGGGLISANYSRLPLIEERYRESTSSNPRFVEEWI